MRINAMFNATEPLTLLLDTGQQRFCSPATFCVAGGRPTLDSMDSMGMAAHDANWDLNRVLTSQKRDEVSILTVHSSPTIASKLPEGVPGLSPVPIYQLAYRFCIFEAANILRESIPYLISTIKFT